MFEAQYIFKGDSVFSPWMARGGDNAIFTADVAGLDGVDSWLEVTAFTKNTEDPGDGTALVTGIKGDSIGRTNVEYLGLKELVRYQFQVNERSGDGSRSLFRMLTPVWFNDLDASGAT